MSIVFGASAGNLLSSFCLHPHWPTPKAFFLISGFRFLFGAASLARPKSGYPRLTFSWLSYCAKSQVVDHTSYPTVLVIVQEALETSTNNPRYCTVLWVRSPCYIAVFFQVTGKGWKIKLDNRSLIRCFGVKYRHIFLLVVCILNRPASSSKYDATL